MLGKRVVKFLAMWLALSVVMFGICSVAFASGSSPEKQGKKYLIYFLMYAGPADPFTAMLINGWETACEMLPVKGVVSVPATGYSFKKEIEFFAAALAAGADGIAAPATDPEMFREPLEDAKAQGVPVILINEKPYTGDLPYIGYVGQDETTTGEALAKRVLKEFKPTRAVIGIQQPGALCLELRSKGIKKVLDTYNIPVEKLDITPEPARGVGILSSYLKLHPDTDMIFTLGPIGTNAGITLIREKGLKGKVRLACMDVDELTLEGIKNGEIICTVAQQPFMQGFLSAVSLYLRLAYGYLPPRNLPTGPTLIDVSNLPLVIKQVETTGGA